MRVIAGSLGGRTFVAPRGHRTHPMSDKMRGAIFNALGDVSGLKVLDAYAGSGALSIEAVSRGAAHVVTIDNDKQAHDAITRNVAALEIEAYVDVIRANVGAWVRRHQVHDFDIVLADPPYTDVRRDILAHIANQTKPGGVAVFSLPPACSLRLDDEFKKISTKDYGDSTLVFYRRIS